MGLPLAVIVVDFENLWQSAINDRQAVRECPGDMAFIGEKIHSITQGLIQQGKETIVFIFFPPHLSRFSAALENYNDFIFVFCPKLSGQNKNEQYDTADSCIYRLSLLIQNRSRQSLKISEHFVFDRLSQISQAAKKHYAQGRLSIFWHDEFTEEPEKLEKRTRENLSHFCMNLGQITDVYVVSGDGGFLHLIQNLRAMGIYVPVVAPRWLSTSLALMAGASAFVEIKPEP